MLKQFVIFFSLLSAAQAQQIMFNVVTPEMPLSFVSEPKAADERLNGDVDTVEYISQEGVTYVSPFPRQLYSQQIAQKVLKAYRYAGLDGDSQYVTVQDEQNSTWLKLGEYDVRPESLLKDWNVATDGRNYYLSNGASRQVIQKLQPQRITSGNQSWCFYLINDYSENNSVRFDWLAVRMDKVIGQCSI